MASSEKTLTWEELGDQLREIFNNWRRDVDELNLKIALEWLASDDARKAAKELGLEVDDGRTL